METLLAAQHELYGRIARTHDNLKKAGASKVSNALIASTLKLLEAKWEKFEEQHERLRSRHWEELKKHEYFQSDFLTQAEVVFTQQRADLIELQEELVKGQKENSMTAPVVSPPRTTLPRIQLPHFSGKYEDWPSFRDLFVSLISRDSSISDVTRLHYLKASLKGEAELLVRSLPTTDENFARAWQTLQDYYENTRLLVRAYYSAFVAQPKLKGESGADLRKLFHCVTSTAGALESIGRPISSSEDLYVFMTVDLLDPRSRREWENHVGGSTDPPTFAELRQFLEQRLHTLEAMQPTKTEVPPGKVNERAKTARTHHTQKERDRCTMCHRDHFIMMCEAFKKKSGEERLQFVNGSKLCLNCLGRHKVSECQSKRSCSVCGARHHSALHDACRVPAVEKGATSSEPAKTSHVARNPSASRGAVLLATARITVTDRWGTLHSVRALIDQGSEVSIVTEALAQRLRLSRKQASVAVFGVGEKRTATARGQITLRISTQGGTYIMSTSAIVLPRFTVYTGPTNGASKEWPHLKDLELADPRYSSTDEIEVLLGADVYATVIEPGISKGSAWEPVAQRTALGWIVSGPVSATSSHTIARMHQCTIDESLSTLVRRFWEQEEVERVPTKLTPVEQECEEFYLRTHSRNCEGRYVVRLPVDASLPDLTASRVAAARMLSCMEARFAKDSHLQKSYTEFMDQYARLGHMSRVGPSDGRRGVCYLPHHGVVKELSTTTKLRVVFNGSTGLPGGESLTSTCWWVLIFCLLSTMSFHGGDAINTWSWRTSRRCTVKSWYTQMTAIYRGFCGEITERSQCVSINSTQLLRVGVCSVSGNPHIAPTLCR